MDRQYHQIIKKGECGRVLSASALGSNLSEITKVVGVNNQPQNNIILN